MTQETEPTSTSPARARVLLRDAKIEQARADYVETVTDINREFAAWIRERLQYMSMVDLARETGIGRQRLYQLIREYPEASS